MKDSKKISECLKKSRSINLKLNNKQLMNMSHIIKCDIISSLRRLVFDSLLFKMIIVYINIMLFLGIIFALSPKKGSVSYSGNVTNKAKIESDTARMSITTNRLDINLHIDDTVVLEWIPLVIIPCGSDPQICIESTDNSMFDSDVFTISGEYDATKTEKKNLLGEPHVEFHYNYWGTDIDSNNGFMIIPQNNTSLKLSFSDAKAYMRNESHNLEKIDTYETAFFGCSCGATLKLYTQSNNIRTDHYYVLFNNPICLNFISDGDLYVSYSLKENIINSTKREVKMNCEQGFYSDIEFESNNTILNLYGMIKNGYINGHSLFPSFMSWYYENVYLTPLTLISALLGGIGLMKRKDIT